MKRWQKIDLFGRTFELDTKNTIAYEPIAYINLDACYGRCSEMKRTIWKQWESWFNANNGFCSVASHNSHFFTIEGYVRDSDERQMYYCRITPAHNYCVKVD